MVLNKNAPAKVAVATQVYRAAGDHKIHAPMGEWGGRFYGVSSDRLDLASSFGMRFPIELADSLSAGFSTHIDLARIARIEDQWSFGAG
ncbi:MAG: hypothetical protein GY811_15790 [Myxococcales bacterium]|nr:hypothetical protein [Myxococcales bacterium]